MVLGDPEVTTNIYYKSPSQYGYAKLQYRFAFTSGSPSSSYHVVHLKEKVIFEEQKNLSAKSAEDENKCLIELTNSLHTYAPCSELPSTTGLLQEKFKV